MAENLIQTWIHTKGDRRTPFAATLKGANGAAVDLTGHTVAFRMVTEAQPSVTKINDQPAVIDSAANGQVSYPPLAADIDTLGVYYAFWRVTRTSDGKVDTYPNNGRMFKVLIVDAA